MMYTLKACQTTEGLYHICYRFQYFNRQPYGINPLIWYDKDPHLVQNSNVQRLLMTDLDR